MIKETTIKDNKVKMVLEPENEIENELFMRFNSKDIHFKSNDNSYFDNRIQLNFTSLNNMKQKKH